MQTRRTSPSRCHLGLLGGRKVPIANNQWVIINTKFSRKEDEVAFLLQIKERSWWQSSQSRTHTSNTWVLLPQVISYISESHFPGHWTMNKMPKGPCLVVSRRWPMSAQTHTYEENRQIQKCKLYVSVVQVAFVIVFYFPPVHFITQTLFKMVSLMPFPCMNKALLPLLTKILSLIYLLAQATEFTVGCPYARALTEYHTLNDTSVLWSHLKIDESLPWSSHCHIWWYNSGFISPLSFLFSRKCLLWTFQRKFTE